jgi:uncharacterized protein (TIGR03437 family)
MPRSLFAVATVCLCLMGAAAQGQNLFLVPGQNSNSNNITVVSGSALTSLGSFTAGAGSFIVLTKPDGSKYYVVANQGSQTVSVLDSSFSNPRSLGNLGLAATAAAITPDGRRLVVVAGLLHVFDTTTDNDLLPNGLNPGANLIDVALSLDGSRAFVLGTNISGGSTLFAVDLSNNTVVGTLPVTGTATAVAVGPNGFVYVSTVNQLIEVNPATLAQTPGGLIPLNARPGKLVFTADGKLGLAPNQTPITGSSVLVIDLAAHTVLNTVPNFNTVLDKLLVAGNNLVFAYSSQTQSLYQITLVPLTINALSIPGVVTSGITAAALSGEIGGGSRTTAQFLYFVAGNTLYRYDVTTSQASGQLTLSTAGFGAISIAGPANTTGVPAAILQYNNNQVLTAGGVSAPLVVRVLDALGRPVSGVTVTFASTTTGVIIQNPSVTTTPDGFAFTPVTAPGTNGLFMVSASVPGGQTVSFSLGVGTGGGTTTNSAQISILAGQGQIIFENQRTGLIGNSSMIVVVKDITGAPVAGAPVTFSITQGPGSLVGSLGGGNGPTVAVNTDNTGQALIDFLSTPINPGAGFQQTAIAVNAPGTNTVNFYITTSPQTSPLQVQFVKPQLGDFITGQAGSTLKGAFIVKVVSILGNPVPNVGIRVANGGPDSPADPTQFPSVSCADPNGTGVLSDSNGTITCDLVFGPKIGSGTLRGNVGYFANSPFIPFSVTPGLPAAVRIVQGNNQTGAAGQTLPLAFRVQVTDAGGNPLGGVPVTFQVIPAGAVTLLNVSSATDQNGNASALGRLGTIAGTAQVRVTAGPGSAIFNVTVSIPVGGVQPVSGGGQTAVVNTAFGAPIIVKVTDPSGNPVAGTQVTFAVTSGSATVGTPTATTDANGLASTSVNAGAAGPITISATSNGFTTSFSLTSRLAGPTNLAFVNGASFQPGVAPGAIVTITGSGIAPGIPGTISTNSIVGPLPISFRGAQVLFNGIPAPIYSISNVNGQESITIQVPFELLPGTTAVVTINAPGGGTTTLNVPIDQFSPGVFETTFGIPNGLKYAVVIRASDGAYISPINPAHPGETDCLFATGLGQVSPGTATNSAGLPNQNVLAPLDIGVNNAGIRLVSATYLPGTVGVYLVCFQIPTDTATGPYQPIGLVAHDAAGNSTFALGTFIPIQ